jgi:transcriptional regulator with XRE-family HTH domain
MAGMDQDVETDGQRVRRFRKRAGLTQAELGRRLGYAQAWVSGVEHDNILLDSISLTNTMARVLNVHPTELTGQPYRTGGTPNEDRGHAAIPAIRRQIERFDLPPEWDAPVRPLADLEEALAQAVAYRRQARYGLLAEACPALIAELQAAIETYHNTERARAFGLLSCAYREAESVTHALGYDDLSSQATMRTREAASHSDDQFLMSVSGYQRVRYLWSSASWNDAMTVIDRTLADIETEYASGNPRAASVTGALHLRAAITAARRFDTDEAWSRYELAKEAVGRLGEHPEDFYELTFTPANVAIHAVAIAVELGDGTEAVKRGGTLRVPDSLPPSRAGHHYMDMARGWLWYGNRDRSLAAIERAERIAPMLIRNHPMAKKTVRTLLDQESRSYRDRLRRLAARMQVL